MLANRMDLVHRFGLCIAFLLGLLSLCSPSPIGEFEVELTSEAKCSSTPLHSAALNGTVEEVASLLSKGADMYALDCQGLSPMHIAIQNGKSDIIVALIENDFDLNYQFKNDETVFFLAARKGKQEIIELLIAYGSNVNAVSKQGSTPLLEANLYNKKDTIALLEKYGASLKHKLPNGDNLLHRAAKAGNVRNVIALIDKLKFLVDEKNSEDQTPLAKAVTHNHPAVINILAARGADLEMTFYGKSYLFLAVESKSLNSLVSLLDHNVPIISYAEDVHFSPLFEAVRMNSKEAADILVKHGANLNQMWESDKGKERGMNLLHLATENGYFNSIGWLVDLGINVNSKTKRKFQTSLHIAVQNNDLEAAKILLDKGASNLCEDYIGATPNGYVKSREMTELLQYAKVVKCE